MNFLSSEYRMAGQFESARCAGSGSYRVQRALTDKGCVGEKKDTA